MCFVCLTVFFLILTWSLHLTVLGYAVIMCSMISLCCLCFFYRLYTDLVSTLDCVGVRCDYVLCDIFMLSLYWPGLYTWLCLGTLWLCALWYLYAVYAFSILTWSLHLTVLGYAVTICSVISLCCLITALCRGLWPALSLARDNFASNFSWTFVKSSWCTACIRLLILD